MDSPLQGSPTARRRAARAGRCSESQLAATALAVWCLLRRLDRAAAHKAGMQDRAESLATPKEGTQACRAAVGEIHSQTGGPCRCCRRRRLRAAGQRAATGGEGACVGVAD